MSFYFCGHAGQWFYIEYIRTVCLEDGTDRSEEKAAVKKQDKRNRTFLVAMLALVLGILIGAAI